MDYTENFKFTHSDGKEYHFRTERNDLTGDQMYTFDDWRTCITGNLRSIKTIVKNIKRKCNVVNL